METVLVTGAAGYIGSVLTRQLLGHGYRVRGLDNLLFGGASLLGVAADPHFEFVRGDVRDATVVRQALAGVDHVVHLAAIVGDPACAKQPDLAREVNWDGATALFELSREAGVHRFVFSSTCSNYGKMEGDGFLDETSPLRPVSLYAELKVKFERQLLESEIPAGFVPTALRFSTVYGLSPRPRFDLTVNEFVRDAALGREIRIFGEQFWRPYCHVEDLARACVVVLRADASKVRQNVFGVGDTGENYQKKMLAEELLALVPEAKISYVSRVEDPRDYRVNFDRIARELDFRVTKRVPDGMREILAAIRTGLIADADAPQYRNT